MTTAVTLEQLVALNDEIVSLVRMGVPLELGLRELGSDSAGALHDITTALSRRMSAGASLPEALAAEEQRLPRVYRTVVEAGLRACRLSAALEAVSNFARELVDLRRRIAMALVYPLIVTALAYVLFIVFIVQVVARFRWMYEDLRLPMHWSLAIASKLAEWAILYSWIPPLALVVAIVWWVTTGGTHLLGFSGPARPLAWIPCVGRIARYSQFANFADLLSLLVEHQVPLPEALRLTAEATGDARLRRSTHQLAECIEQGNLANRRSWRFGFPPFLFWVLTSDQRAEGLARLLRHAGSIYRRRAVNLTNWLNLLFPIAAAVIIGGGVTAFYAVMLFGPLTSLLQDLGMN